MDAIETTEPRDWDPLLRIAHWAIAAAVLGSALFDSLAHVWVGYAALGVLALRVLWGFVGPGFTRFAAFPPDPRAALGHLRAIFSGRRTSPHRSQNPLDTLMAYALWAMLAVVSATGVMLETDAFWGAEAVEELHELCANALLALAAIHVAGVAIESRRTGANLIAAMIDGERRPERRR